MNNDKEIQQIKDLFQSDPQYVQNEKQLVQEFIVKMQVAKYNKNNLENNYLIQAGMNEQKQQVFILQGKFQNENTVKDLLYYMLSLLLDCKNQEFYIIFINTDLLTHSNLSKFYSVFKTFPLEYFLKLQKIYIVHGNIFIKSWFWFQNSVQIKILKQKTVYLEKVIQLCNTPCFKYQQFEKLPSYCRDSSYPQLQQAMSQKQQQQVVQTSFNQLYGLELDQYEFNNKGIPLILDLCITKLLSDVEYLKSEGLFRISASITLEKQFENFLIQKQYQVILDYDNIIVIANFLKRVLDKLSTSVLLPQYYLQIVSYTQYSIQEVQNLVKKLPEQNQKLFTTIILLLHEVQLHQYSNKMGAQNLSIVFGISLCRLKDNTQDDVQVQFSQIKKINSFIQFVIENATQIFPNQKLNDFLMEAEKNQDKFELEQQQQQY